MKKIAGFSVLILLLGSALGYSLTSNLAEHRGRDSEALQTASTNWLQGWLYRKAHNITGSTAGEQHDYQMTVDIHYYNGFDNGGEVYLDGKCQTDFGDVRFTDQAGTILDYWIERKTDSVDAVFWVKVNYIPQSPSCSTIYIYYGNPTALTTSNGRNTFQAFREYRNDFYTALGMTPPTNYPDLNDPGDYFVSADTLDSVYISCAMWLRLYGGKRFSVAPNDLHFEEYADNGNGGGAGIDIRMGTAPFPTGWQTSNSYGGTTTLDRKHVVVVDYQQIGPYGQTWLEFCPDWYVVDDKPDSTAPTIYYLLAATRTTEQYIFKGQVNHIWIYGWELWSEPYVSVQDFYNIWYCVAKYANPEPSHGTWTAEETSADTTPPEIVSVEWAPTCPPPFVHSSTPRQGEPVLVTANVTEELDGSGIDSVCLTYRVDSGEWVNMTMTYNSTSNVWVCVIAGQVGNSSVELCIRASDHAGNMNTSQPYSYTVKSLPTGDIDGDGMTDMADISLAIEHFMQT